MTRCSPRNVIDAQVERTRFPTRCEYRFVDTPEFCSGVTLRDLIERKEEGS